MPFFDRFRREKKQVREKEKLDPAVAALQARLESLIHHRDGYLKERGLESQLLDHERPFAVITLAKATSPQSLKQIAGRLQEWLSQERIATRILGLEQMLQGQRPQVAASLLQIPMSDDPETWISSVALVIIQKDADEADLPDRLFQLLAEHSEASLFSLAQYSAMTR